MKLTRRTFLRNTASATVGASALATLPTSAWAKPKGANSDIRIGVIGFNSKGKQHLGVLKKLKGVRVTALCDADQALIDKQAAGFKKDNQKVETYTDMRKLFESKNVDAILTATPNHWHALATIWALQAGKHVYVEKPSNHNIWEGGKMIEAAKKYGKVVQVGFQNRSDVGLRQFFPWQKAGNIGKIKRIHGLCFRNRSSIGKVDKPLTPPDTVDYNIWLGPADDLPMYREKFHYDWHWIWNTGNGDMGNQGPHELDLIQWARGDGALPNRVMSFGGRFGWNDGGETPNMQLALFDFGDYPVSFEVRDMTIAADKKSSPSYKGLRTGIVVTCEGGEFRGGRGGGWVYDNDGKKMKQFKGDSGGTHQQNFIDAIRANKPEMVHTNIENGVRSSNLAHLANVAIQTGNLTPPDTVAEKIKSNKFATERLESLKEQLSAWNVDTAKDQFNLGGWLEFDPKKEVFTGGANVKEANKLLTRKYRGEFVVPEKV